jgi:hypothetical protein
MRLLPSFLPFSTIYLFTNFATGRRDMLTLYTGKGETVPGTSINADQQTQNQNSGTADHLDMAFRKQE